MQLKGKTILLTGATGGIGRLVATRLHAAEAKLVLGCFMEDALRELNEELGGAHVTACADLSTMDGRQTVVDACVEAGGIDAVINLAGILDFGLFEQQPEGLLEKMVAINLTAPILLSSALLPQLKSKSRSVVLNVGSIFGSIGHPGFTAYCATKSGLMRFSEALGRELADSTVRVAYIAPRATNTGLNDDRVNGMNKELGIKTDSPELVADEIVATLQSSASVRYLGWPEKLFVRLNALLPSVVGSALIKNLAIIKRYAAR